MSLKNSNDFTVEDKNILNTAKKYGVTSLELNELLRRPKINIKKFHDHSILGNLKIGIIADTHIGHKLFDERLFAYSGEIFRKNGVKTIYHAGDILEGTNRDGQIYELDQIGFSQQIGQAERLFKKYYTNLKVCAILGNHDLWYLKKNNNGVNVGEELQNRLGKDKFEYLGDNEADIKLGPRVILKLSHPGDGTAYAWSYKLQKFINSLGSGKKPNILVEAHYHKNLYMFIRNIHAFEGGTLCGQTSWMRSKRIECSKGFWLLDMDIGVEGILRLTPSFYPDYE